MSELVGSRLGDYQVLRRLGSGGMADVFAARHLKLHRDVALKVLRLSQQGAEDNVKRFRREAQAAARLNHPSIVQIYEISDSGDQHYIAQELVDGVNLKQWLDRHGQLTGEDAINVLRSVGGALQVAHSAGITHRDIKPENIMRGVDGSIKVTDFGLARMLSSVDSSTANLTRVGLTLGTPRYMSPEQIQGHDVGGPSDLYSLGVTLYHLLAGSPPFDAEEPLALAVKHLHETPPPLDHARGASDLPAWLVATVMRLLQKAPESRFASAGDLLLLIEKHAPSATPSGSSAVISDSSDGADEPSRQSVPTPDANGAQPTIPVSLGTMSATIQLQRVTDATRTAKSRRRQRLVLTSLAGVCVGLLGFAAALWARPQSVGQTLRGPTVTKRDTVTDQYLVALTRGDVPGWEAVSNYFPPEESPTNAEYHHKATLQLARLLIEQERPEQANALLNELERSAQVQRLHHAIALVLRHQIAVQQKDDRQATRVKTKLKSTLEELGQQSPTDLETFRNVVPQSELSSLGIVDLP